MPRRNIETWLAYLDAGKPVDEAKTYPRLRRARDCDRHAGTLFSMCRGARQLDAAAPLSLREACEEYGRLRR